MRKKEEIEKQRFRPNKKSVQKKRREEKKNKTLENRNK
jgi:hypothetical protein